MLARRLTLRGDVCYGQTIASCFFVSRREYEHQTPRTAGKSPEVVVVAATAARLLPRLRLISRP